MKLRRVEAHKRAKGVDVRGLSVYEDTHGFDFLGELGTDLCGIGRDYAPEASFIKVEAEGIGAGVRSGFGVGKIGDAADFDANHGS